MFVRFVPMNGAEFKHAKLQVEPTDDMNVVREKVSKHFNIENFKLLFQGRLIQDFDGKQMSMYHMNANSTIHVIESANASAISAEEKKPAPSNDEIQQFLIAFGLAVRNPAFHKVAQRLGQRENLENIVATCPDLGKDPVACAFLSKPELLYSLLDQDTLKFVHERHPGLWEAAYQLAAAVHEEKPTPKSNATPEEAEVANPFAYNLDEMSDEDDEGEDMETGEVPRGPRRGRRSIGEAAPITADQLASAIANAQSVLGMPGAAASSPGSSMGGMTGFTSSRPPTSAASTSFTMPSPAALAASASSSSRNNSANLRITQNQLAEALALACGNAFQATPGSASSQSTSTPVTPNYDTQLATMRELGIMDERLATRALQVMGGDVQAAIDLIYSGWSGDDDSAN